MPATMLTLIPPDAEWMQHAKCAGHWMLMESDGDHDEKLAKSLCAACPVWRDCRAWTLSLPPRQDVEGVAGGLTAKERDLLRRRIRRAKAAPESPKECRRCHETQAATEFYLRPRDRGGREAVCRTCRSDQKREARRAEEAIAS